MVRKTSSGVLILMFPIKMLLRAYSLCVLMVDVVWVLVNAVYAVIQAVYEVFRPPPLKAVDKETALVVGSGRGVGRELAIQLALQGTTVLCVDYNEINNNKTVTFIKRTGGTAHSYTCDITKKDNVSELATKLKTQIGFVSMVFYCCGIPSPRSLMTQPPQNIHVTLDLTLTSFFWWKGLGAGVIAITLDFPSLCLSLANATNHLGNSLGGVAVVKSKKIIDNFMPEMKKRNHGHIVALTSVAGLSHIKDQMPLSVAQFAVQGLAESLMEDLRINKINGVHVTLTHIYPFIVEDSNELRLKIPSYFGTITPEKAATSILESVRRNYAEASVPKYLLFMGHVLRLLPRKATVLVRDLLDTGVDFG